MQVDHQCANDCCDCTVSQTGDFCSDACRTRSAAGSAKPDACDCQHVDCGTSAPGKIGKPGQDMPRD